MPDYKWYRDHPNGHYKGKKTLVVRACTDMVFAVRTPAKPDLISWLGAMGIDTSKFQNDPGWFVICGDMPKLKPPPGS